MNKIVIFILLIFLVCVGVFAAKVYIQGTYNLNDEQSSKKVIMVDDYVQAPRSYSEYEENKKVCTTIVGMSMAPAIFSGNTVCYAKPEADDNIKEGDIIIFNQKDSTKMHRVISNVGDKQYVTKGDNNSQPDTIINREDIIGVVTEVRFT